MAHFYLDESLDAAALGDRVSIDGSEARHAVTVSRVRPGEPIIIGNGAGLVGRGTVIAAEPTELTIDVTSWESTPPASPSIWLAQALAKGDRDESAVQAATELGVDGVIPWSAQRSIVKWEGARQRKGIERWSSIVREATKQSVRPWVPEVSPLLSTKQLCELAATTRMLVLEPTAENALSDIEPDERDVVIVIGPEGGIAPSELSRFALAGAEPVRLGDTILRTGSAGPAAIAALNVLLGRW